MSFNITIPKDELKEFCQRHHIRKLWLFGSVLRGDFRDDSDIDMMYEFQPGKTPGWEIITIENRLSELFGGRKVDFVLEEYISRRIRKHPMFNAEVLYDEG